MAQITWRNIAAPNLSAPLEMAGAAYEDMGDSLDPLKEVIDRRQKQKDENYIQETENINTSIQANLQKLSLAELNQAEQSGALSIDAMEQQYGKRVDMDLLNTNIGSTRKKLQENAINIASSIGTTTANKFNNIDSGASAFYDSYKSSGATDQEALRATSQYKQNASVLQSKFDTEIEKTTTNFLLDKTFKKYSDIDQMVKDGVKKHGSLFDPKAARASATQQLIGSTKDAQTLRETEQRVSAEALENVVGDAYTMFTEGRSSDEILTTLVSNSNLNNNLKVKADAQIKQLISSFENPTGKERIGMANAQSVFTEKVNIMSQTQTQEIAGYDAIIKNNQVPQSDEITALESRISEAGFSERLGGKYEKGVTAGVINGFLQLFNPDIQTGTKAANSVSSALKEMYTVPGMSRTESMAIVAQAMNYSSEPGTTGPPVLNIAKFNQSLRAMKSKYDARSQAIIDKNNAQARHFKESATLHSQIRTAHNNMATAILGSKEVDLIALTDKYAKNMKGSINPIKVKAAANFAKKVIQDKKDTVNQPLNRSAPTADDISKATNNTKLPQNINDWNVTEKIVNGERKYTANIGKQRIELSGETLRLYQQVERAKAAQDIQSWYTGDETIDSSYKKQTVSNFLNQ